MDLLIEQIMQFFIIQRIIDSPIGENMEHINSIIILLSFVAILAGIIILINYLLKRLNRGEFFLLIFITLSSFFMRVGYGLFGPIRQHDHSVQLLINLKRNFLSGNLLFELDRYPGSGGLFEFIYNIPVRIFSEFNVYTVYYTSVFVHLLIGLMVFLLALNLFRKKEVAFISLLIFSFLPILIIFSATETIFIINALTISLFINFGFYFFKKEKRNVFDYLIFLGLFSSNLVGRREFLPAFSGSLFFLLVLLLIAKKPIRNHFLEDKKLQVFTILSLFIAAFYWIFYALPEIAREITIRTGSFEHFNFHLNSLNYFDTDTQSSAQYLKSFFSPAYFFIMLMLTPLILFFKKRWWLIIINGLFLFLFLLLANANIGDFRMEMPFMTVLIPQVAFTFYFILSKIKLSTRSILIFCTIVIVLSTAQNGYFLTAENGRKIEQDFLMEILEEMPENSLILTVHEKKYEESKFSRIRRGYQYNQHGMEFNTHLLPVDKKIDVMDIYLEYDPEMLPVLMEKYDNVFYYRSLYGYHEKIDMDYNPQNPDKLKPFEATMKFENQHNLKPIRETMAINRLHNFRKQKEFERGFNYDIFAEGELLIGLYRIIP